MRYLIWLKEEEGGQGIVEYALLIAGIALALMFVVITLDHQIFNFFSNLGGEIIHHG